MRTATRFTARDPVLDVAGLTKFYGETTAVNDLSLRVEQGEIFGILGRNGAGKTTSVECAQGLRRPDSGTVHVLVHDPIRDRTALSGRVGSQLQDSSLPDRLRVGEAISLFAEDRHQAEQAISDWQLNELIKQPFVALSGGQRQRLFLALALLNQPEIVFLDELTQGLDPDARRAVWKLVEQIRDRGTTVILVTHFMEEAEILCDRVAVMSDGQLIATGTPTELIDRYGPGVRIRFEGAAEDLNWINKVPGVSQARVSGSDIDVTGPPTVTAHLGHALVERGRAPVSLRVHQPGLEDALLAIMQPSESNPARKGEAQ